MKKYNRANKNWFLLGILIPIVLFYLSFNVAYAFFTATAKTADGIITTGIMKVQFSEDSEIVMIDESIESVFVLPGDTLTITGAVENIGTVPMYALLEVTINIEESRNGQTINYVTAEKNYYRVDTNGTKIRYDLVNDVYITGCTLINQDVATDFSIDYTLHGESYGSEYQGKAMQVIVKVYGIQTVNLNDGVSGNTIDVDATNILLGKDKPIS